MQAGSTHKQALCKRPKKGFFLSLPSAGAVNTLNPMLENLLDSGYEILYYNAESYRTSIPNKNIQFRPYPSYTGGYKVEDINQNMSLFKFGEVLIETADGVLDFLIEEVEKEKPDFILHTHLVLWGRLLARKFQLPSITLFTTFVLDSSFMKTPLSPQNQGTILQPKYLLDAKRFYQKAQSLSDKLGIKEKIEIWDVYVNGGDLNLSFILKTFQPRSEELSKTCHHLGFPLEVPQDALRHEHIYVSLGTIFNRNTAFFRLCIEVLSKFQLNSIISAGKSANAMKSQNFSKKIVVREQVDQVEVLKKAAVFLSHGGMASVHEAVYTHTPMIVIPKIPEQILTAQRIQELGLGIHLPEDELTEESLCNAIHEILRNHAYYVKNLKNILEERPAISAVDLACDLVEEHLNEVLAVSSPI